jgi:SAM-dependent methyltransferase
MQNSIGQDKEVWTEEWRHRTIESEIQMWDFFGTRPWILKYTPRFGKVIEAGCGLGRYVFLLNKFGIDIEGLDFSLETIEYLLEWQRNHDFNAQFKIGDITQLPYSDNLLSGYLSFGVIEHFIEGPQKPLQEAYRVLKPGGVAIITTPSKSWFYYYSIFLTNIKALIKGIIGIKKMDRPFFQYWYTPTQLKDFIEDAGFIVTRYGSTDMLYAFREYCKKFSIKLEKHKWLFTFSQKLEKTFLNKFSAQSVVIAIKPGQKLFCFLCGQENAEIDSLKDFDVPICNNPKCNSLANYYTKKTKNPKFNSPYIINPPLLKPEKRFCGISNLEYLTDCIFEDYGFSIPIHPEILKNPEINIKTSNLNLKPVWRNRS